MAIPQGKMSTFPVVGVISDPDNRTFYSLVSHERGPIYIEDTSEGLQYQNWTLTWDSGTNLLTATPETTGPPVSLITEADLTYITFTFDQSGRISFTWVTSVSSFMYWYDTDVGGTVTTDLGADVITPSLFLDDKRTTQTVANDMMLYYTKEDGFGTYTLYSLLQRERFLIEHVMETGLDTQFLFNCGMANNLRVHISLSDSAPWDAPVPPPPPDPDNLDFESGDTNWTQEAGTGFSIDQSNPHSGAWNGRLDSIAANYSRYVNDTYFPVTGSQEITINVSLAGPVNQGVAIGYQVYDAGFSYIGRYQLVATVAVPYTVTTWVTTVPAAAVHIRLIASSNGFDGTFHLDNFTLAT